MSVSTGHRLHMSFVSDGGLPEGSHHGIQGSAPYPRQDQPGAQVPVVGPGGDVEEGATGDACGLGQVVVGHVAAGAVVVEDVAQGSEVWFGVVV